MKKLYIKGDGNGGYVVTKQAIALFSVILIIISMIVPLVFGYGKLNQRVENIEDIEIEELFKLYSNDIVEIQTKVNFIYEDIQIIKEALGGTII